VLVEPEQTHLPEQMVQLPDQTLRFLPSLQQAVVRATEVGPLQPNLVAVLAAAVDIQAVLVDWERLGKASMAETRLAQKLAAGAAPEQQVIMVLAALHLAMAE
jgi:hypothetical protein